MSEQVRALGPLIEKILRGPTLIKVKSVKSDFNRRAAADFEAAFLRRQQSERERRRWRTPSKMRAIRRCRKQGVPPMMGPLNSRARSGPGASHRENFRGPTLIKVKSVKSDFDRRAAADFEAAFLRNQQSRRESRQGGQCSRGRAIRRCRKQGVPPMMGPLNFGTSSVPGASHRENFTRSDFNQS